MFQHMHIGKWSVACTTLLLLACQAPALEAAADANGAWNVTISTPQGDFEFTLELAAEGEKLTGKLLSPAFGSEGTKIENGTFKNDQVNFSTTSDLGGQTFTSKYQGKIEGDEIKGQIAFEIGGQSNSMDFVGKRAKKPAAAASSPAASSPAAPSPANGTWKITIATPQGDFDLMLDLEADGEKLSGKVTAPGMEDQPSKFTGGTIKQNDVAFKVTSDFGGQSITSSYKGKIDGDAIKGNIDFDVAGQTTTIEFSGKREKKAPESSS